MEINSIKGKGYDSNVYLVRDEKNVIIDAGTGDNFDYVMESLRELKFDPSELDILINTHCHYDHVGGDPCFVDETGCRILASEGTAEFLKNGDEDAILLEMFNAEMQLVEVDATLEDGQLLDFGKYRLRVIHTPGHSTDCISLYEPDEKVLFSGDTVFGNGIGRVDLPYSDRDEMRESLRKLSELSVSELYPGHGPTVTRRAQRCLRRSLNFLPRGI
ncbi:MAG: MBL fold metallo-hydrolase [Candidatus Hadarchaeota archaeon]